MRVAILVAAIFYGGVAVAQSGPGAGNAGRGPAASSVSILNGSNPPSPITERGGGVPDSSPRGVGAPTSVGTATVQDAGLGALVGPGGQNAGALTARVSAVSLDGKPQVAVDLYGDKLLSIAVSKDEMQSGSANKPLGDGDQVKLSPRQASRMIDSAVNMNGVVQAQSISLAANGDVVLGGAAPNDSKPNAPPSRPSGAMVKSGSTTTSLVNVATVTLRTKAPPTLPSPTFNTLLATWARTARTLTPGDALANGAWASRDGGLFAEYIVDVFNSGFPVAYALGATLPAVDYAVCYLVNMWAADACSAAAKL